jgi:hypothetical protein
MANAPKTNVSPKRPDVLMRFFGEARIETVLANAREEKPLQDGTGLDAAIRVLDAICTKTGRYFNDDDAEAVALLIRRASARIT